MCFVIMYVMYAVSKNDSKNKDKTKTKMTLPPKSQTRKGDGMSPLVVNTVNTLINVFQSHL